MRNNLLAEREKTHGKFENTARISQKIKDTLDGNGAGDLNDVLREALHMIAVKTARILAGDEYFKEHWKDIAGYADLGAEECDKHEHQSIYQTPSTSSTLFPGGGAAVSLRSNVTGQ